ncbi:Type IV fimbrial assembly protein PilC [hydrothermal vent metagenome]|uniref:Type IV fimbrial assembly protein PilC n=1 Tax=hydrothermal vent metagenome TaxID=652676 RepID=A0A3B1CAH2_9ZZZZ
MTVFQYKFETKVGSQKGEIEAETIEAAKTILSRQRIKYVSIKKKPKDIVLFGGGPTSKDLVVFTRQFATMISAGLPLVQCLSILGGSQDNKIFGRVIVDIKSKIESGETFADALRKHPKIFDELFTNMVEAGEVGGILDKILIRLADYMEKAMVLKGKVKSAMVYPSIIVTVAVAVVIFLLVFVIPMFGQMFADFGQALPWPTQVVLTSSNFVITYWYIVFLSPVALVSAIIYIRKTEKGLHITDRMLIRLPVLGVLIQKVAVAKFTRTMGTLISSGVPIIEGLNITARTAGQKVIESAVIEIIEDIKQGKGLSEPLREQGVFPSMVTQMIEVGEQTGALDDMMTKIADFYDQEVDTAVEGLTSMLEPMLMVFLGVVVGFVVVAMYMPIFMLGDVLG